MLYVGRMLLFGMDVEEQGVQPDAQAGMQLMGAQRLFPCLPSSPLGPQDT